MYTDIKELFTYSEVMWDFDIPEIMTIRTEYIDIEQEKKKYMDNLAKLQK